MIFCSLTMILQLKLLQLHSPSQDPNQEYTPKLLHWTHEVKRPLDKFSASKPPNEFNYIFFACSSMSCTLHSFSWTCPWDAPVAPRNLLFLHPTLQDGWPKLAPNCCMMKWSWCQNEKSFTTPKCWSFSMLQSCKLSGLLLEKPMLSPNCLICLHLMFILFFQSFLQVMYLVVSVVKLVLNEPHSSGISLTQKKTECLSIQPTWHLYKGFFSPNLWCSHSGNCPQEERAKLGYSSERTVDIF